MLTFVFLALHRSQLIAALGFLGPLGTPGIIAKVSYCTETRQSES